MLGEHRRVPLVFTDKAPFHPPGLPLAIWEVATDSHSTFEVEVSGRIIKKDSLTSTRWASAEFTGTFSISMTPSPQSFDHKYAVQALNGYVTRIEQSNRIDSPLLANSWSWFLDALDVDVSRVYRTNFKGREE